MRLGSVAHAHLIGLTCALKGPREQDAFTETEYGVTARRRPDALYMPRETTEAGPRRIPPLIACGGRAASARNSVPEPQLRNNGRGVSANAQFFHQPLTVSTASDSAE